MGVLKLKYDDHAQWKGKRLRIARNGDVFRGIMKGLAESIMAVSPTETLHPWLLQTDSGATVDFLPEGQGWEITEEIAGGFKD
jgi:hypothetical protein